MGSKAEAGEQAGTGPAGSWEPPSRCKQGSPQSDVATDKTFLKSFFFFLNALLRC